MRVEQRYRLIYKPLVWLGALLPLALLLGRGFGLAGGSLGADPAEEILRTCGKTALNLLLLTLAVTPLRRLLQAPQLLRLRRLLGLFAFFYAVLHLLAYAVLELQFDWPVLGEDIVKRPYITLGFVAVLLLAALAATSTQRAMRRLGRRWQRLHWAIYPAALLGVWHFWWQVKADIRQPALYAAILTALLGWRLWWKRRAALTSTSGSSTTPGRT
ncbi:MAG: sulfoxide reductase heme-binding subunit YedZ [Sinobacteraceae bacterium]|nr:sulfoxide reductase heme-binding subunit YedZ [Nevskiaceae bacterium]MCP5467165.1 sulfoxide reductase heme-binding subunit YedZ [Nevskiaceae bacterium]MCP5472006.1 sulfoxide reductase heme-binding subunit YedZ [Nevskiaceae bacterium]